MINIVKEPNCSSGDDDQPVTGWVEFIFAVMQKAIVAKSTDVGSVGYMLALYVGSM